MCIKNDYQKRINIFIAKSKIFDLKITLQKMLAHQRLRLLLVKPKEPPKHVIIETVQTIEQSPEELKQTFYEKLEQLGERI